MEKIAFIPLFLVCLWVAGPTFSAAACPGNPPYATEEYVDR